MSIRAKLLATVSALVVMGALGAAKADDKTQPAGTQGLNSVDKNADTHPNRGLTNAETRIQDNINDRTERKAADRDDKKKKRHDADDKTRKDKAEHAAKGDRPERPQHPDRAGRS